MNFYSKIDLQNHMDVIAHPNVASGNSQVSLQKMLPLSGGCDLRAAASNNSNIYNNTSKTLFLNNIRDIGRYYWNSGTSGGNQVYKFEGLTEIPTKTTGVGYTFELIVSAQDDDANNNLTPNKILQTLILRDYNYYTDDYYTGDEQIIYKRYYSQLSNGEWSGTWSGYFLPKLVAKDSSTFVALPKFTTYSIVATNQIQAESFLSTSDQRLKTNIRPYAYNTEKTILDLPIYKYDFINGMTNQIGCLAQELQEICPELVSTNDDGFLSINESKIVYLLLQEIQKLKTQIDNMEQHYNEL